MYLSDFRLVKLPQVKVCLTEYFCPIDIKWLPPQLLSLHASCSVTL